MTVTLTSVVAAHPVRAKHAQALADRIGCDVIYDTNPTPSAEPAQRWATTRRAWETAAAANTDWSLVIQDDAIVCQDFHAGMTAALTALNTDAIVSPYLGTSRPMQPRVLKAIATADEHRHTWIKLPATGWAVALAAPTHTVPDMLTYCSRPGKINHNIDTRIDQYYREAARLPAMYTHPQLADHRGLPSLIGRDREDQRRSHRFIGTHTSALTIKWASE